MHKVQKQGVGEEAKSHQTAQIQTGRSDNQVPGTWGDFWVSPRCDPPAHRSGMSPSMCLILSARL